VTLSAAEREALVRGVSGFAVPTATGCQAPFYAGDAMMRPRQLSYANVMSTVAVFIALGGTSYAVARNSIGNAQLKSNAVTSSKVKNFSLRAQDLAPTARIGVRGPRGLPGPPGVAVPGESVSPLPAPQSWSPLSFAGGWANYGAPYVAASYRKDQLGRVYLRGLVTRTDGLPPAGSVIATLPSTHAPPGRMIFGANGGPADSRVDVLPNGQVLWIGGTAVEKDYTSLDQISFAPAGS
jgi:hypothetical protein